MKSLKRVVSLMSIILLLTFFCLASPGYTGQTQPDITKSVIKSKQIGVNKKKTMAPGSKPALRQTKIPGVVPNYLEISWFKVSKTQFKATALSHMASSPSTLPKKIKPLDVEKNEQLYFTWSIRGSGIDPNSLTILFNGFNRTDQARIRELPNNRFVITDSIAKKAVETYYTLSVRKAGGRRLTKKIRINLLRSEFELLPPEVDQNRLKITIKGKNSGTAAMRSASMPVRCVINPASYPDAVLAEQDFILSNFTLEPGDQMTLGEITLPNPDLAFASDAIIIHVNADIGSDIKEWHWTWAKKTISMNAAHFRLLGMGTNIDIKINNYDGSVNPPYKENGSSILFSLDEYDEDIPFDIPPHTDQIGADRYQTFLRNITCSHMGDRNLFFIENGKIGMGLYFPNPGSRHIKRGRIKKANPNKGEWQDGLATDADLRPFTIKAFITPVIENNKITYNEVEVDTSDIAVRTSGDYPGLPSLRRYLSRVAGRHFRDQIELVLKDSLVKNTITSAINNALITPGTDIHRLISLRVENNSIVLQYF